MRIFAYVVVIMILFGLGAGGWLAFSADERTWVPATAEVSGFGGGQNSKRGLVTVYVRNATGYGALMPIPPSQLNCKVGQRVAVQQAGRLLRSTGRTCRDLSKM